MEGLSMENMNEFFEWMLKRAETRAMIKRSQNAASKKKITIDTQPEEGGKTLFELPNEILLKIFLFCDLRITTKVCKHFHAVSDKNMHLQIPFRIGGVSVKQNPNSKKNEFRMEFQNKYQWPATAVVTHNYLHFLQMVAPRILTIDVDNNTVLERLFAKHFSPKWLNKIEQVSFFLHTDYVFWPIPYMKIMPTIHTFFTNTCVFLASAVETLENMTKVRSFRIPIGCAFGPNSDDILRQIIDKSYLLKEIYLVEVSFSLPLFFELLETANFDSTCDITMDQVCCSMTDIDEWIDKRINENSLELIKKVDGSIPFTRDGNKFGPHKATYFIRYRGTIICMIIYFKEPMRLAKTNIQETDDRMDKPDNKKEEVPKTVQPKKKLGKTRKQRNRKRKLALLEAQNKK